MNKFYDALAILAVILTPVAMMTALGWTAYSAILTETRIVALAVVAGVATAAAVECIGIVAGETALWFHGRNDARWKLAALILVGYVAFGIFILQGTALALLPIMASAVYVLIGLRAQAQRETTAETVRAIDEAQAGAIAAESERQWQHEQWRIQQADRTRIKMAQAEVTKEAKAPEPPAESAPKAPPLSPKAREIYNAFLEKPTASYTEIAASVGVSRQFVGQVARQLNGSKPQ
jgi:hypothetical protein